MKNPFKPDRGADDRDNPVVPNVIEEPTERAADRAVRRDNPLVPNVIERPVERVVADDRGNFVDRPGINDGPGDRPGVADSPADIARGARIASTHGGVVDRPGINDGPGDRRGIKDSPADIARGATTGRVATEETDHVDLFPSDELARYRGQWETIQAGFVDQPRAAVEQADALVGQVVNRLTEVFTRERATLEGQWTKGNDASSNESTEELRLALKRYRSFFHRLLSM